MEAWTNSWILWLFLLSRDFLIERSQCLWWSNSIITLNDPNGGRPKHKSAKLISHKQYITTFSFNWYYFHDTNITHKMLRFLIHNACPNIAIYLDCIMINNCYLKLMRILCKGMKWFYYWSLRMWMLYCM